ncbi:hypothetical protein F5146DRAFT_1120759 [Armillaria mellea]|nr:hypothetical protein F5146DRAFT_1120759 [Armillaria mellea]
MAQSLVSGSKRTTHEVNEAICQYDLRPHSVGNTWEGSAWFESDRLAQLRGSQGGGAFNDGQRVFMQTIVQRDEKVDKSWYWYVRSKDTEQVIRGTEASAKHLHTSLLPTHPDQLPTNANLFLKDVKLASSYGMGRAESSIRSGVSSMPPPLVLLQDANGQKHGSTARDKSSRILFGHSRWTWGVDLAYENLLMTTWGGIFESMIEERMSSSTLTVVRVHFNSAFHRSESLTPARVTIGWLWWHCHEGPKTLLDSGHSIWKHKEEILDYQTVGLLYLGSVEEASSIHYVLEWTTSVADGGGEGLWNLELVGRREPLQVIQRY